uniref:Uncharacterized protein n=1 Tax=Setaria italica TaxID=4555 RepID=K3XKW7_SETIT
MVDRVGVADDAHVGHCTLGPERLLQYVLPQLRPLRGPGQQPREVAAAADRDDLQLGADHRVGGHVFPEEPLGHGPRRAGDHHLPPRGEPQALVDQRVELLHVVLGQDGAGDEVHVPGPEPREGDERHDPDAGAGAALPEGPDEREGAEQQHGAEQAAALEGHEHEVGEERGGAQQRAVHVAHHRPVCRRDSGGVIKDGGALGGGGMALLRLGGGRRRLGGGVAVVELEGLAPELPGGAVEREEPLRGHLGEDSWRHHLRPLSLRSFPRYST